MPGKPPKRPPTQRRLMTGTLLDTDPAKVSRHLSEIADRVNELDDRQQTVTTSAPATGDGSSKSPITVSTFTRSSSGVVSAPGGSGTTRFACEDGTWSVPAGGGGSGAVSSVTAGSTKVMASPTTGAVVVDVVPANLTGIPESGVTNLVTDLASKAPTSRLINTTAPLSGGGDLTADRTLSIAANGITNALLAQGPSTSVVGVAGAGPTNRGDIASSANGQILAQTSGSLAFTAVGNIVQYLGLLGDGSDGAIVFNGSSTITLANGTTIVPASNVYTLNTDICATDITINPGVTVKQASGTGWRIFFTGTLLVNGTLSADGTNGVNQTAGSSGGGYTLVSSGGAGSGGGNGGGVAAGAASTGIGSSFYAAAAKTAAAINTAGTTGGAAQGGTGGGGAGFTGGAVPANTQVTTNGTVRTYWNLIHGKASSTTSLTGPPGQQSVGFHGSGGSGGGANATASSAGGGGGGGAGVITIIGRTVGGSGTISCKGGNGGNGNATGAGNGGGGGGGGGTVIAIYANGTLPTTVVTGGTGGSATGTGGAGGNGGNGSVITVNL